MKPRALSRTKHQSPFLWPFLKWENHFPLPIKGRDKRKTVFLYSKVLSRAWCVWFITFQNRKKFTCFCAASSKFHREKKGIYKVIFKFLHPSAWYCIVVSHTYFHGIAKCQILGKTFFVSVSAEHVIHIKSFSNKLFGPTCMFM